MARRRIIKQVRHRFCVNLKEENSIDTREQERDSIFNRLLTNHLGRINFRSYSGGAASTATYYKKTKGKCEVSD